MNQFWKNLTKVMTTSYLVWACFGFICLDLAFKAAYPYLRLSAYNSPNRSWVWWAVRDFHQSTEKPDVVLLGSSLMMAALHNGDATYLNLPQNVAVHHRSSLLEELWQNQSGNKIRTFAFAIGGQMVSDAYALTSTLLVGQKKPKLLVYGIAPRDFMDNTLTSPASTETFRYMSRLGGLKDVAWQSRPTFWEQVEYGLACVSPIYEHRLDFVYLQHHYVQALLKHLTGFQNPDEVHTPFVVRRQALLELPEDQGINDLMVMPDKEYKYDDNSAEYRMRYRAFKPKLFEVQVAFLERLLRYCQTEGIELCLVNMPLTVDNVKLMPPGFYDSYKQRVLGLTNKYQARFIDLNDTAIFSKTDFADSVHMNGNGGVKFFRALSTKIAPASRLATGQHGVTQ
ncbi:MAG: hypothetical protein K2W82_08730 [Candidatus Obscuribacterales bacterium]|nr:hypothetical protein [Candidatus Obscuribacterales bacterium]